MFSKPCLAKGGFRKDEKWTDVENQTFHGFASQPTNDYHIRKIKSFKYQKFESDIFERSWQFSQE